MRQNGIGRLAEFKATHHPWPCPHSPRVILRCASMLRPANAAIITDSAGTTAARLIPSRNVCRPHPPRSNARLQISSGERHISNPKPYAITPGCREAGRRGRRTRNRAHEDQFPTQEWRGFLGGCSNRTPPPKGHTDGDTVKHSSGAPHRAWGGSHSERQTHSRKASSTHARPAIQIAASKHNKWLDVFKEGGRTHILPHTQRKRLPPTHRCAPTPTHKRASESEDRD